MLGDAHPVDVAERVDAHALQRLQRIPPPLARRQALEQRLAQRGIPERVDLQHHPRAASARGQRCEHRVAHLVAPHARIDRRRPETREHPLPFLRPELPRHLELGSGEGCTCLR
ncbi:MAG TPA: hypothetical protein VFF12_12840, partial [Myxococcaceae bacterium]|nr:hypothetical protein [Myxococcaceae bacterium]